MLTSVLAIPMNYCIAVPVRGIRRLSFPGCSKISSEGLKTIPGNFQKAISRPEAQPSRPYFCTNHYRRLNMLKCFLILILLMPVVLGISRAVPPQAKSAPFSPAPVSKEVMERNKKAALEFYDLAINKKDYQAASKYLGSDYKQHNPLVGDGKEGFKAFLAMLKKDFPQAHSEVKRVFADGNYVIIHVHSIRVPNTPGRAIFDCFRFDENGKVVEHWDAIQDIPVKAANQNGMF
jgi:predicted SnoaL-like aldol condensation-catalyzing enzyme